MLWRHSGTASSRMIQAQVTKLVLEERQSALSIIARQLDDDQFRFDE